VCDADYYSVYVLGHMLLPCYMLVVCFSEVCSVCACGQVESDYPYHLL